MKKLDNLCSSPKTKLRQDILALRKAIDPNYKDLSDDKICSLLKSFVLDNLSSIKTMLLFSPLKIEVDITAFTNSLWNTNLSLAFPRCLDNSDMCFCCTQNQTDLTSGMYGILEPSHNLAPATIQNSPDTVCIVPALAYDHRGFRLGFGKGYYDRFFAKYPNILKIGVCYSNFIYDCLPTNQFDIPVDKIITEKGVFL